MKLLFALSAILLLPIVVAAHPVDDLCPPGKTTEDGCQPVVKAMMLDVPEFYAAHKAYWHCRRELVADLIKLGECVGQIELTHAHLGEGYARSFGEEALLTYWEVIPAHPELDFMDSRDVAANVYRAKQQTQACMDTRDMAEAVQWFCMEKRTAVQQRFANAIYRAIEAAKKPRRARR